MAGSSDSDGNQEEFLQLVREAIDAQKLYGDVTREITHLEVNMAALQVAYNAWKAEAADAQVRMKVHLGP